MKLSATLEMQGTPIGNLDLMIAARPSPPTLILVSSDVVFKRVKGLQIEDRSK